MIAAWSADMEEDQGGEWARTVLHGMIRRPARAAGRGVNEPERTLGRILVPLLDLRRMLRADGAYDLADEANRRQRAASGCTTPRRAAHGGGRKGPTTSRPAHVRRRSQSRWPLLVDLHTCITLAIRPAEGSPFSGLACPSRLRERCSTPKGCPATTPSGRAWPGRGATTFGAAVVAGVTDAW